jgi:choline dehydrogenase-like flavoprotein
MSRVDWDVIIVGTGAGGGTLAQRLAPTGKRILLLERGGFLPREPENWSEREVVVRGRYRATERWLDADGSPFEPFTHFWVGGNTKLYGAALFRLREDDFDELVHCDGPSPAWPLRYQEIEPYYGQAERLYHVHGETGLDPHEPPRSTPFAYPPLAHEPRVAQLAARLRDVGLSPFPLPLGVRLPQDEADARAPVSLGAFDGYPDPTETKADAHVVGVDSALRHPNVVLRTGALVEQLLTSASGREVTGVVVRTAEGVETLRANIVVLACGAILSAALLLRSANEAHPRGLANRSDQVGRNLMLHNNGALIVHSSLENDSRFQKTFALTDYYRRRHDTPYPLGSIQLMGRSDGPTLCALFRSTLPDVGEEALRAHTVDFWLTTEDLPLPHNRVRVTPSGQVQLQYTRSNGAAYALLQQTLEQALRAAEPNTQQVFAGYQLGIAGVSHQCGTLRFGEDPASSVLDRSCRAHELDNLYVADASFFVSSGAVNPSLTIMANALRLGDHLSARLDGRASTASV